MLRQRPGQGGASLTPDVSPLDSDEQAKVVASLGNEAQQQNKMFSVSIS